MSSDPFGEVPALPVAIPFGALVLVVQVLVLLRGRRFSWPRAAVAAAIAVYAAGILANTVFPIFTRPVPRVGPWTPALALVPFSDYEVADALMNVGVFVPLGILLPLLMRRPAWWKVLVIAATVSVTIELLQLGAQRFFAGGHVADVNDFLWNTVGGCVGYALYALLSRIPVLSGIVDVFRWHRSAARTRPA